MPETLEPPAAPPVEVPPATPPAEPPADGPYAGIINPATGEFTPDWTNKLEGDEWNQYRDTAAGAKSVHGLVKRLADTQKAFHEKTDGMVRIPKDDAPEEDIAAYRAALGIPESPEAYELTPEQVPAGVEILPDELSKFAEKAHELGLTPAQAKALTEYQINAVGESVTAQAAAHAEWEKVQDAALHEAWGGEYTQQKTLAARGADTFGLGADHPLMKNAEVAQAFANAAAAIDESKLRGGEEVVGELSARHQIKDIRHNPNNKWHAAFNSSNHAQHAEAKKHVDALYQQDLKENPPERAGI